jgi:hypothetical protein
MSVSKERESGSTYSTNSASGTYTNARAYATCSAGAC